VAEITLYNSRYSKSKHSVESLADALLLLVAYPAREYERTYDFRFKEKQ
jgi:hypothetical protein